MNATISKVCRDNYKLIQKLHYPEFFFTNSKVYQHISADFGVCGLMKEVNGKFVSKVCKSCYSASLLNMYHDTAKKLKRGQDKLKNADLGLFEEDVKALKAAGIKKLRTYSLGDYSPAHKPFLEVIDKYMKNYVFSKTLFLRYRSDLVDLGKLKRTSFSLSLNPLMSNNYIQELQGFIIENGLMNVQLNYCFFDDNYEKMLGIDVYHTVKKDKLKLAKIVGYDSTCCIKDPAGKTIKKTRDKAVCEFCNMCSKTTELRYLRSQV